jgi:hypothetical protein
MKRKSLVTMPPHSIGWDLLARPGAARPSETPLGAIRAAEAPGSVATFGYCGRVLRGHVWVPEPSPSGPFATRTWER